VIKDGSCAGLVLVDGDPLQQLELVAGPDKNFVVIMKVGKICKKILQFDCGPANLPRVYVRFGSGADVKPLNYGMSALSPKADIAKDHPLNRG
jgi:hypothetical protein